MKGKRGFMGAKKQSKSGGERGVYRGEKVPKVVGKGRFMEAEKGSKSDGGRGGESEAGFMLTL